MAWLDGRSIYSVMCIPSVHDGLFALLSGRLAVVLFNDYVDCKDAVLEK